MDFFDQRKHITHAQDALRHSVGIERLQRIVLLAYANELHRLAGDLLNRQGRAAAGIPIHFCQHHAGDTYACMELFSRSHRVLSGHGISDEENLDRMRFALDPHQFVHQLIVDVQATCGIDQKRVITDVARLLQRCASQFKRIIRLRLFKDRLASRLGDDP